jgi:hypothetical protein
MFYSSYSLVGNAEVQYPVPKLASVLCYYALFFLVLVIFIQIFFIKESK